MIGHLEGQLLRLSPSRVLLAVSGVGYDVHIPLSTYSEIQHLEREAALELFIHTHVREEALQLFGFRTELEKQLFEKLIAVSGIGPRLALAILSMAPTELVTTIRAGDVGRLSSLPGIGKKTAERMLIELRDKLDGLATDPSAAPPAPADRELVQALTGLGYKVPAAERAVAQVTQEHADAPFPELLRLSLKKLSRV